MNTIKHGRNKYFQCQPAIAEWVPFPYPKLGNINLLPWDASIPAHYLGKFALERK
jgi:hypothetical protein